MSKPTVKKLDGRRINNQRAAEKRAASGRTGRGAEFVIHGKIESKRDPGLQERIDKVVAEAKARELDAQHSHSTDVLLGYHTSKFRVNGLKCTRIG